jgi:hypothetical protein
VRRADVTAELFELATWFPLLRPDSQEFDAWLDARDGNEITKTLVEEGGSLLSAAERERIAHEHAREFPEVWRSFVEDLGDEAEAEQIVLIGAIVAALKEPCAIDSDVLELIAVQGDELESDPAEILSVVLDPVDVWSIAEATTVDAALRQIPDFLDDDAYAVRWSGAVEFVMTRLWSPRHDRRLARLVRRLRARVELVEDARVSELLRHAYAAFERDEAVRMRLASLLLIDSVDLLPAEELDTLAA